MIQECIEFREIVQNLMDRKEIEFSKSIDPSINVIIGTMYSKTPSSIGPKPIMIFHDNEMAKDEMPKVSMSILVVEVPRPFPYESQKVVPWDYNYNYTHQTAATDLIDVGGITRSGCCYAPDMTEKVALEKLSVPTSEEQPSKEKEQPSREKKDKKALEGTSKLITDRKSVV